MWVRSRSLSLLDKGCLYLSLNLVSRPEWSSGLQIETGSFWCFRDREFCHISYFCSRTCHGSFIGRSLIAFWRSVSSFQCWQCLMLDAIASCKLRYGTCKTLGMHLHCSILIHNKSAKCGNHCWCWRHCCVLAALTPPAPRHRLWTLQVLMGVERKSAVRSPESLRRTAYHESGHALVSSTRCFCSVCSVLCY